MHDKIRSRTVGILGSFSVNGAIVALALYQPWARPDAGGTAPRALVTFDVAAVPAAATRREANPPAVRGSPRRTSEPPRTARRGTETPSPPRTQATAMPDAPSANSASAGAAVARSDVDRGVVIAYRDAVRRHVSRFVYYPREAARIGWRGTVTLHVELARDGAVRNVWIERSAGTDSLDTAALVAIQHAAPMPPIPAGLPDALELSLPIDFSPASSVDPQRAASR